MLSLKNLLPEPLSACCLVLIKIKSQCCHTHGLVKYCCHPELVREEWSSILCCLVFPKLACRYRPVEIMKFETQLSWHCVYEGCGE